MSERLPIRPGKTWSNKREIMPAPSAPAKYSLAELANDFHFFNHGALFQYGGLKFPEEDPVNDWYVQQPKGVIVVKEAFNAKIFEGLDTFADKSTFNHLICAVRHSDWHDLWAFLCSTAIVDRVEGKYREVFSGDIKTLDPVAVERFGILADRGLQPITVTVFGIDGNDRRWEPMAPSRITGAIRFSDLPPRPEVVATATAVLTGDTSSLQTKANQALDALVKETDNAN